MLINNPSLSVKESVKESFKITDIKSDMFQLSFREAMKYLCVTILITHIINGHCVL